MESALIIAHSEKNVAFLSEILKSASIRNITSRNSCADARLALIDRDFDLVIINAPLPDETGENLARQIGSRGPSQVILVVKLEHFEAVSAASEADGVLCVSRPLNRQTIWGVIALAKSAHARLSRLDNENYRLKRKLDDIILIDKAKRALIEYKDMTEQEAYRYIAKGAMDKRLSKRDIAERVLKEVDMLDID